MHRPSWEVADIFRQHGRDWRETQQGHLSLNQLKVMSAIERCRSAQAQVNQASGDFKIPFTRRVNAINTTDIP
ncbi:MAG: hypothetical protein ACI88A_005173 [Paraglaciecola sp.]|jgi:hypothetical protein